MIECLQCLPCCCGPSTSVPGVLKGREVCPAWRMAPGIVSLAACCVCIAHFVLKRNYYFCIPPGIGALASLYFIYLGYQYKDLQSLHQSAKEIAHSNQTLQQNVQDLNGQIENQAQENDRLNRTVTYMEQQIQQLGTQAEQREAEIQRQKAANLELEDEVERLRQQADQFDTGLDKMADQLQASAGNLDGLRRVLSSFEDERSKLSVLAERLIQLLAPAQTEEYRKAATAWAELEAKIRAHQQLLPELEGLIADQKLLGETYKGLFEKTLALFQALESQQKGAIESLGAQETNFERIKQELQKILEEFKNHEQK